MISSSCHRPVLTSTRRLQLHRNATNASNQWKFVQFRRLEILRWCNHRAVLWQGYRDRLQKSRKMPPSSQNNAASQNPVHNPQRIEIYASTKTHELNIASAEMYNESHLGNIYRQLVLWNFFLELFIVQVVVFLASIYFGDDLHERETTISENE